jgi:hypothetical protein
VEGVCGLRPLARGWFVLGWFVLGMGGRPRL